MELRQLRYFLAVARTLNFTRAAEEMNIAQPPLSRQISHLEDELGTRLIDRDARPVRLTEAGVYFRERASQIIARIDRLKTDTRNLGRTGHETLRIGIEVSVLYSRFPNLLKRLRAQRPQLDFDLIELSTADQIRMLKQGTLDVGFGHDLVGDPEIEQTVIRRDMLVVALPPEHPLAKAERETVRLEDLKDLTLIIPSGSNGLYGQESMLRIFERHSFVPSRILYIKDLPAALGLVAADIGACLLPAFGQRLRSDDICYKPVAGLETTSAIVMNAIAERPASIIAETRAELLRMVAQTRRS